MIGYVYITTNERNGTVYIGKRQKPRFERCYKGSGKRLKLAFEKYGRESFSTAILEECDTTEDLCEAEKKWIRHYKENGFRLYNIAEGGKGGNNVLWAELPQTRREEINEKNRAAHLGERNPFYGKRHSEEMRKKARERLLGKSLPNEHSLAIKNGKREHLKPICQIDKTNGKIVKVWGNWAEAGESFSAEHGRTAYAHISECCKGTRKSAFGFIWRFAEVIV